MTGPFKLGYFFRGAGKEDWIKAGGFLWRAIVIVAIIVVLVRGIISFFPTQKQTQQNIITVQPGGTVNVGQSQKQETKKWPWWLPHPFIEAYGFHERMTDGDSRTGVGGRAGARLEW